MSESNEPLTLAVDTPVFLESARGVLIKTSIAEVHESAHTVRVHAQWQEQYWYNEQGELVNRQGKRLYRDRLAAGELRPWTQERETLYQKQQLWIAICGQAQRGRGLLYAADLSTLHAIVSQLKEASDAR